MRFDLRDALLLVGVTALVTGVSYLSVAGAWMTAGGLCLAGWVAPLLRKR